MAKDICGTEMAPDDRGQLVCPYHPPTSCGAVGKKVAIDEVFFRTRLLLYTTTERATLIREERHDQDKEWGMVSVAHFSGQDFMKAAELSFETQQRQLLLSDLTPTTTT